MTGTWKRPGSFEGQRRPLVVSRRLLLCVDPSRNPRTGAQRRYPSFGRFVEKVARVLAGHVAALVRVEDRVSPPQWNRDDGYHVTVDVAPGACCALTDARAVARELERAGYAVAWWEELVWETE